MPQTIDELAVMIAARDGITVNEAKEAINVAAIDMETAFYNGDLDLVEDILKCDLGLEPDYLMLFID